MPTTSRMKYGPVSNTYPAGQKADSQIRILSSPTEIPIVPTRSGIIPSTKRGLNTKPRPKRPKEANAIPNAMARGTDMNRKTTGSLVPHTPGAQTQKYAGEIRNSEAKVKTLPTNTAKPMTASNICRGNGKSKKCHRAIYGYLRASDEQSKLLYSSSISALPVLYGCGGWDSHPTCRAEI